MVSFLSNVYDKKDQFIFAVNKYAQLDGNIPTSIHKNLIVSQSLDLVSYCSFKIDFIDKYNRLLKNYKEKGFSVAWKNIYIMHQLLKPELVYKFIYPYR